MTTDLIARMRARAAEELDHMPDYDWASVTSGRFGPRQCTPKDVSDMARDTARAVLLALDLSEAAELLERTCKTCRHRIVEAECDDECAITELCCTTLGHHCGHWERVK
jgi:hypothetical protein